VPVIQSQPEILTSFLDPSAAVDLAQLRSALGGASRATVFRYLVGLPYRRSYNKNGRYYTGHDPTRYDRFGLRAIGDAYFSSDGALTATVRRLVQQGEQGYSQRELEQLLRVRVQAVLGTLVHRGELGRQSVEGIFVYLHAKRAVQQTQLGRRSELLGARAAVTQPTQVELPLDPQVVIEVLLVLIHHPGSQAADVLRRLRGHRPRIVFEQVRAVFDRYELDQVGQKRGR
jgi:hypothetical protein